MDKLKEKKTLKELNLEDDFLFSKVMNDKEICKEFLEKLLDIKIEKIEEHQNEKVFNLAFNSRGIRLDVYLKDENNTVYNIEMQRTNKDNLAKRLRYYQSGMDIDSIEKGEKYQNLSTTYIIFICTFDLFEKGRHRYTFETTCVEDASIKLKDDALKIILNTTGIMKDISEELIDFLEYIEHSDDEVAQKSSGSLSKNAHKKVLEVKNNPKLEVEYMKLLDRDRENREEGRLEGRIEGRLEGREERTIEMAQNLLDVLSVEVIAQKTGLSIDEVNALKNGYN